MTGVGRGGGAQGIFLRDGLGCDMGYEFGPDYDDGNPSMTVAPLRFVFLSSKIRISLVWTPSVLSIARAQTNVPVFNPISVGRSWAGRLEVPVVRARKVYVPATA